MDRAVSMDPSILNQTQALEVQFSTDPKRIPNGPRTDPERTSNGPRTDPERTPNKPASAGHGRRKLFSTAINFMSFCRFKCFRKLYDVCEHARTLRTHCDTMNFRINWSISELNTQVNPTTCLGDTDCWIQQVTTPTLVVTCWNQQSVCILPSTCTGGRSPPCPTRM